jgi:rsbT co-antagonist protein RsbR
MQQDEVTLMQAPRTEGDDSCLPELVSHLRDNRTGLREEWAQRITDAQLLSAMSEEEIFSEVTSVFDKYVDTLETGSVESLQEYAEDLSERIIPRGVETHEVLGIVLLLRDVLARSLFQKYQEDFELLNRVLDAYEPAANRIAVIVGVSFVQERERVIGQQQATIGELDSQRAAQLTDQLLNAVRSNRARVVVIDITGVPSIDKNVANHLVQTVRACRLMGAAVLVTGLSSDIARTLVTLGVDLSMMDTVGDLQGGIEEAEHLLGYEVRKAQAASPEDKR